MRIVLVVTTECQLRCPYCLIKKVAGTMDEKTAVLAVDAILHRDVGIPEIHFFGGEPLMEKDLLRSIVSYTMKKAADVTRNPLFCISTNALAVDEEFIEWINGKLFSIEVSIDGSFGPENITSEELSKPYNFSVAANGAKMIIENAYECFANMVVTPSTAPFLSRNFEQILSVGFKSAHISPATGVYWNKESIETYAQQLWDIYNRYLRPDPTLRLLNLEQTSEMLQINREITVATDGSVYTGNAFLYSSPSVAEQTRLGHISDGFSAAHYYSQRLPKEFFLKNAFSPELTYCHLLTSRVIESFSKYVRTHR